MQILVVSVPAQEAITLDNVTVRELKDISLPESMKRSMSRQAEAERERRARVIAADGEYQAPTRLAEAATVMAADPAALRLRLLQTVAAHVIAPGR
jgi:regulator of protease activity HflC (stomatin/prohibitin superfamily)